MTDYVYEVASPIGPLTLDSDGDRITGLHMNGWRADGRRDRGPFQELCNQLDAYWGHELSTFDVAIAPHGTRFQAEVWDALRRIPYGHTVGYGELARKIGRPRAARAVGRANGANPIAIVVPCHRVVGADGSLTGFGGGIDNKRFLLEHEGWR